MPIIRQIVIFTAFLLATAFLFAEKPPSQQDLKKIQASIEAQIQHLDAKNSKRQQLIKQLKSTEIQQAGIQKKIHQLNTRTQQLEKQFSDLKIKQRALEQKKQQQTHQMEVLIGTTYRLSKESKVKLFLNQESPHKISRALIYADYINQSHSKAINAYRETIESLEAIKPDIVANQTALKEQQQQLLNEKTALTDTLKARKKLLAKINTAILSGKQRLTELKADQHKLAELLKAVEQAIISIRVPADTTPFSKARGKLPKPVKGKMINRYGKRIENTSLKWQGISFDSAIGNKVIAVHYGRVIFSGWFRGKGLLMILDHGEGYMTLYAHNQTLLHEAGDWINEGDTIATVGNSGGLDHSELYFEIRHQGQALSPKKWFK